MRHLSLGLVAAVFAVAAEPAIAQPATWTGFYVGANIGGSWGNSSSSFAVTDATTGVGRNLSASDFDMHGVIGGGQFGYNWQSSNWVLGLEADIQASSQKGVGRSICAAGSLATGAGTVFSSSCLPGHLGDTRDFDTPAGSVTSRLSQSLDWFGTVRGRVGYIAAPGLLAYLTGGLAYGRIESTLAVNGTNITGGQGTNTLILTPVSAALNTSHINTGWTIGAGTEINLSGNWTAKIEYLYVDLGTVSGSTVTPLVSVSGAFLASSFNSHITDHIARFGLNYRWAALSR
jgi:outer membrane immunogenic protein